jgi:uncharacterized Zn finger protein
MSDDHQRTAWGARWIDSLERLATAWQARLPRGRDYADKGHVISLSVTSGRIAAKVQGSRSKPYSTSIDVGTFRDGDWERMASRLASQARWSAELLAGHIPNDTEVLFNLENLNLFPVRNSEMLGNCSCPDKSKPCKHIAAVHYAFGNALDRDPFLLFQLRGLDQTSMVKMFRKAWFGASASTETAGEVMGTAELGMSVMPLMADRFNRSPESVDAMSFNMLSSGGQPMLILSRLGSPPSWSFPISIIEMVGDIYQSATELAMQVALAEPVRQELVDGDLDDLDGDFDFDPDLEDYDEFDDGDEDGEDETDLPLPPVASDYKALTSDDRVIDGRAFAFPGSAPPTAASPSAFSPSADLFLPKSLAAITDAPGYKPTAPKEDERSSVLIRKGIAAVQRRRTKKGTTSTLKSSTESTPVIPSSPPATPVSSAPPQAPRPGLPGSVVAVTPKSEQGGPPVVRRRKKPGAEPAVAASEPPSAPAPAEASLPALELPAAQATQRAKGRRVVAMTPDAPVAPSSAAESEAEAGAAVRRRKPRTVNQDAVVAEISTLAGPDLRKLEQTCRTALDSGNGKAAMDSARKLWDFESNETRFLMMMSAAELAGCAREVVSSEADKAQVSALRSGRMTIAEMLLLMTAGRMEVVARLFEGMGDDAWLQDELAYTFIPYSLVCAIGDDKDIPESTSLLRLWDEVFSRGEKLFDGMDNPPAPLGVWLQWALDEFGISGDAQEAQIDACKSLIDRLARSRGLINTDQRSVQAAALIGGLLETLTMIERPDEGRSFLASVRPLISSRRRIARALEEVLEASALLDD